MTTLACPIHPGEILLAEFMRPLRLDAAALAAALGVPPRRIEQIVAGRRPIPADLDLRLARFLRLPDGFFLRLQLEHDLEMARHRLGSRLDSEVTPRAA